MAPRIHPAAEVSTEAIIGEGSRIWHWAQSREGARVGQNCVIGKDVYVDATAVVGDDCKVENFASIYRGVTIGNRVFIGPHVCFTNDTYPRADSSDWDVPPTIVAAGASVGAHATTLCRIRRDGRAMVAAGENVTKDVLPHSLDARGRAR